MKMDTNTKKDKVYYIKDFISLRNLNNERQERNNSVKELQLRSTKNHLTEYKNYMEKIKEVEKFWKELKDSLDLEKRNSTSSSMTNKYFRPIMSKSSRSNRNSSTQPSFRISVQDIKLSKKNSKEVFELEDNTKMSDKSTIDSNKSSSLRYNDSKETNNKESIKTIGCLLLFKKQEDPSNEVTRNNTLKNTAKYFTNTKSRQNELINRKTESNIKITNFDFHKDHADKLNKDITKVFEIQSTKAKNDNNEGKVVTYILSQTKKPNSSQVNKISKHSKYINGSSNKNKAKFSAPKLMEKMISENKTNICKKSLESLQNISYETSKVSKVCA